MALHPNFHGRRTLRWFRRSDGFRRTRRFGVFNAHGDDALERGTTLMSLTHTDVLTTCASCHAELNVQSLGIVRRLPNPLTP
jgi:hypothetical protein